MLPERRGIRRLIASVGCLAVLAGGAAWSAALARADGDPASDVLVTQPLFLPQDAGVSLAQELQLQDLLRETARSGYPVRVAMIASPSDLGSVTELWRQPALYAKFLGQELSLTYRGPLLVIMPNGFGFFDQGRSVARAQAALQGVPVRRPGAGFAASAVAAVRQLAGAAGHPVSVARAASPNSTSATNVLPWIAFGIGVVVIALAWAASLRARPVRLGHSDAPSS